MIVVSHPNRPSERRIAIGYWNNIKEGMGGTSFVIEMVSSLMRGVPLQHPTNFVDEKWDEKERKMVVSYLDSRSEGNYGPKIAIKWRGYSNCRICGNRNGSTCIGDDKFIWPSGFSHYVKRHGVRPPREFIDHVKEKASTYYNAPSDPKLTHGAVEQDIAEGLRMAIEGLEYGRANRDGGGDGESAYLMSVINKLTDRAEKAEKECGDLRALLEAARTEMDLCSGPCGLTFTSKGLNSPTPQQQNDILHPSGKCRCGGEGKCDWCQIYKDKR